MEKTAKYAFLLVPLFLITVSCGTHRKVTRLDPTEEMDLSGRWNDVDSKQTAEAMIRQITEHSWVNNHQAKNNGSKPKVIVGLVKNKSHEHIDAEAFVKDVEKSFIMSGKVRLIQGGAKRNELRSERTDQNKGFTLPETVKKWGKELGADYMLQGTINSIVDTYKKKKVVYYHIDLQLTNLETNEVIWIGDKKIKKYVKN